MVHSAWHHVKPETIAHCFEHAGFSSLTTSASAQQQPELANMSEAASAAAPLHRITVTYGSVCMLLAKASRKICPSSTSLTSTTKCQWQQRALTRRLSLPSDSWMITAHHRMTMRMTTSTMSSSHQHRQRPPTSLTLSPLSTAGWRVVTYSRDFN